MALTVLQSARVNWVIGYLEAGSAGRPLDGKAAEELQRVFGNQCGFTCGCPGSFMDGLRESPFSTLLTALLCVSGDALSVAQIARIQAVIDYLVAGSAGLHIDDRSVEELARIFCGACDFVPGCPGTFQEGMRDAPFSTLLRAILCVNSGTVLPDLGPGPAGDVDELIDCEGLALFAVLAGETITNTGFSVLDGDLGLSPGTSVTGFPPGIVLGTQHVTDTAAADAQIELTAAYLDLEGRLGGTTVAGNIGGQTLSPGIYKSASSLAISSGELTLDGGGNSGAVFIFQIASTLTMTSGRQVILTNGTQAKNVFWQVGSSATIGSTAILNGSILALTSITAVTGAVINGRLLARNGAVTLDSNAVTAPDC